MFAALFALCVMRRLFLGVTGGVFRIRDALLSSITLRCVCVCVVGVGVGVGLGERKKWYMDNVLTSN